MNFIEELKSNEFKEYMIVFFIPSSTPLYMLFRGDFGEFGVITHGSVLVSYILANLFGGIGSFFLYRLGIFEHIKNYFIKRKERRLGCGYCRYGNVSEHYNNINICKKCDKDYDKFELY